MSTNNLKQKNHSIDLSVEDIEKMWKKFKDYFWFFFVIKVIFARVLLTAEGISEYVEAFYAGWALQIMGVIGMVIVVAYYSYKFTGQKIYLWNGLLGLFWFAIIGIFLAFTSVQRLKNESLQSLGVDTPSYTKYYIFKKRKK